MSDDQNDKSGGWFGNPLPIVMVVLLAAGVLVKNVPLESARPTDPERVVRVDQPAGRRGAAVAGPIRRGRETQEELRAGRHASEKHPHDAIRANQPQYIIRIATLDDLKNQIQHLNEKSDDVTVVAVSVFGGPFAEDAESRRRSRFAVVSALGFHDYHPESNDAIGYFQSDLSEANDGNTLTVPYRVVQEAKKTSTSNVLVLWLKDETLADKPLTTLHTLSKKLAPTQPYKHGLNVKLIGPAGSATLRDLVNEEPNPQPDGRTIEVYSPSATISNCDLLNQEGSQPKWDCFKNPRQPTGKDDTSDHPHNRHRRRARGCAAVGAVAARRQSQAGPTQSMRGRPGADQRVGH